MDADLVRLPVPPVGGLRPSNLRCPDRTGEIWILGESPNG